MSQDYFTSQGEAAPKPTDDSPASADDVEQQQQQPTSGRPGYMTVGSGSASVHASRLQQMIDDDSGYGTLAAGETGKLMPGTPEWEAATGTDFPLHSLAHNQTDRSRQASAVHQLWYNQHRGTLGRSINKVMELLRELQEKNAQWPAHYPSVHRPASSSSSRPAMQHTFSALDDFATTLPMPTAPSLRRATTSYNPSAAAESSRTAEQKSASEPRLVTPQLAQEFSVLKLDLKLGALSQAELVHSLEKASIASLLDGKISSSLRHLASLRERIEDTSSKVLITGDLNAGKSTFCNALLRRKILPEDQQPCTSIFCEVLDARENSNIEEVHAVHKDAQYSRNDESTYDVYSLADLETLVVDNSTYAHCKVYVKDVRTIDESLINNGVVDIALIDAPGLNSDTTKTTAVFARQEEIDVVVFVVSAANHFTMTAKEFIWAAAAEKAYLFMVVNGYDTIKDKQRCQKMVLEQVHSLSPRTFKESSELVHFVSSNAVPMASPPGGPDGGDGSGGSGGPGGDDPADDSKGKGKDQEKLQDFQALEQSLRRFVLEKRARSKLAPARTYLMNILGDVNTLATVNTEVAQSERDRVSNELREIEPQIESSKRAKDKITDEVNHTIDETCDDVYSHTRNTLNHAISRVGDDTMGVPYPGLFGAYQYAEELKEVMLERIQASVTDCEDHARTKTISGVNTIKQLGILHLGDEYAGLEFRSEYMFRRQRDAIARQIDIPTELWDFFDWSTLMQRQEKVAGTGMALTLAGAVGTQVLAGYGWMDHAMSAARLVGNDNLRRLIVPGLLVAAATATVYIVNQIPRSLPQRISTKITAQLTAIDYVHGNANRISRSVRKVLRMPANDVVVKLQQSVETLGTKREQTIKVKKESDVALKYFTNLARDSAAQRTQVENVNLDDPPAGAGY